MKEESFPLAHSNSLWALCIAQLFAGRTYAYHSVKTLYTHQMKCQSILDHVFILLFSDAPFKKKSRLGGSRDKGLLFSRLSRALHLCATKSLLEPQEYLFRSF